VVHALPHCFRCLKGSQYFSFWFTVWFLLTNMKKFHLSSVTKTLPRRSPGSHRALEVPNAERFGIAFVRGRNVYRGQSVVSRQGQQRLQSWRTVQSATLDCLLQQHLWVSRALCWVSRLLVVVASVHRCLQIRIGIWRSIVSHLRRTRYCDSSLKR
jgi:hypothetical protein